MVLVVLGIDALDPELVDPAAHPNLGLDAHAPIETINSAAGEPSTHELWPTIITGLTPDEHGLVLDDGVTWENPVLSYGSTVADSLLPQTLQTKIGAWLLTNTRADAFRAPATYYRERDIETLFDGRRAKPIGVPNYVVDPDSEDREHVLRRRLGDLFERDPEATGGHRSSNPGEFYEQCMEMAMIRIARARRALRGGRYELVFAYTSGLDLVGHVTYDLPELQRAAYDELDQFVGELRGDLRDSDELLLVSDHGLQEGVHTEKAMVASTDPRIVDAVDSVLDIAGAIETALSRTDHAQGDRRRSDVSESDGESDPDQGDEVRERLENLGYM